MEKLTRKRQRLFNFLIFGLLLGSVLSCGKKVIQQEEKFVPSDPNMVDWYDGNPANGEIDLDSFDVKRSTANWEKFSPTIAPEGAPNILFVLYDDTGLGAWSPYGGLINMPTMDSLAANGLTYTQWHTTALCSPTRSTILTGRNHHLNGMASITETADGFPGANGRVPDNCAPFAQILQDNGYSTFWIGKNHNVPEQDVAPGGLRSEWPCQIGFERFYGFLGGETNNWYPDLVEDNHFIEAPYKPEEGYHLSKDLADNAIKILRNQNASNPSKPWYLWYNPGANHAPHHAPEEYIRKYRGVFDDGYEAYRDTVVAHMKAKGIIPEDTQMTPLNFIDESESNDADFVRPWESLSLKEKQLFSRMAEVYAGFSEYTDAQVGRLIDYLKESGQYENTIILYAADNGASGEGSPDGSVNENKFFNGYPDDIDENMKYYRTLGSAETYNHYPTGWAAAFSAPFKMFKRYSQYAGGTNDPLVICWPKGIKTPGELRHQYHHSVDIVPTLFEAIDGVGGVDMPGMYNGVEQKPLSGVSMAYTFEDIEPDDPTHKKKQYYCMLGTRGIWKEGFKAAAVHAPLSGNAGFREDVWELYEVDKDRSEYYNLADSLPYKAKLEELKLAWAAEADTNNILPLDDRSADQILTVERPSPEPPTDTFTYYPFTAAVPEGVAVNVRGRSYTITAHVSIINKTFPSGIIFAHGSRFGGHTIFIKENVPHYVYNFLGIEDSLHVFTSTIPLKAGDNTIVAEFTVDKSEGAQGLQGEPIGFLRFYVNGTLVDSGPMATQPAKFTLSGDGLCVGYDSADAITDLYPEPSEFNGGTLKYVGVWVDTMHTVISEQARARRIMRSH